MKAKEKEIMSLFKELTKLEPSINFSSFPHISINGIRLMIGVDATSVDEMDELLQIDVNEFDDDYIIGHFDNVICQIFGDQIDYDFYMKNVHSTTHEGIFDDIFKQRDKIKDLTKSNIHAYTETINLQEFTTFIIERLKLLSKSVFLLYKDNEWKSDRLNDGFENIKSYIKEHKIVIETDDCYYTCSIRWRSGVGVNSPYWKIKVKKSENLTLTQTEIKEYSILYTPPDIVKNVIDYMMKYYKENEINVSSLNVCEPSCGNGAFLISLEEIGFKRLIGYELNDKLFKFMNRNHNVIHEDFLYSSVNDKFDLIIGAPPFHNSIDKRYKEYFETRTNAYVQFIIHSLYKLNDDGIMAFIIPNTFMNSTNFIKVRKYIQNCFQILTIWKNPLSFMDPKHSTITIIIKRTENIDNSRWYLNSSLCIENQLESMMKEKHTTIKELIEQGEQLKINESSFIWTKNKQKLIDMSDHRKLPVLIYHPNNDKKRMKVIDAQQSIIHHSPVLLVNRGYGQSKYKFIFELIDDSNFPDGFICESRNLIITGQKDSLKKLFQLFSSPKTQKFVSLLIEKGELTPNELMNNVLLFDQ